MTTKKNTRISKPAYTRQKYKNTTLCAFTLHTWLSQDNS